MCFVNVCCVVVVCSIKSGLQGRAVRLREQEHNDEAISLPPPLPSPPLSVSAPSVGEVLRGAAIKDEHSTEHGEDESRIESEAKTEEFDAVDLQHVTLALKDDIDPYLCPPPQSDSEDEEAVSEVVQSAARRSGSSSSSSNGGGGNHRGGTDSGGDRSANAGAKGVGRAGGLRETLFAVFLEQIKTRGIEGLRKTQIPER